MAFCQWPEISIAPRPASRTDYWQGDARYVNGSIFAIHSARVFNAPMIARDAGSGMLINCALGHSIKQRRHPRKLRGDSRQRVPRIAVVRVLLRMPHDFAAHIRIDARIGHLALQRVP